MGTSSGTQRGLRELSVSVVGAVQQDGSVEGTELSLALSRCFLAAPGG